MSLCTKNDRPLTVSGDKVYSSSGTIVGRISGDKVFGTDAHYVGTLVGDRLVYRSTESASVSSSFSAGNIVGSSRARVVSSAVLGDEPDIPD